MEHAQPLDRSFSLRAGVRAVAIVLGMALATVGGLVLLQRLERTPAVTAPQVSESVRSSARQAVAPMPPRSHVAVLVLNGDGVAGAAGDEASRLLGRGYRHVLAANATTTGYATSLVLFRPGREREAKRLAHDAGIRTVAPLDGSLPSADAGYPLVVILGAGS